MRESWDRLTNSKSKSFKQSKSHVQELSKKVPINPISWTYSFATKIEQHPCCPATSLWSSLTTASLLRHHCSTPELIMQQKLHHRSSLQHICFLGSVPVLFRFCFSLSPPKTEKLISRFCLIIVFQFLKTSVENS